MATTEHDDVEVTSTRAEPLEGDDITVIPEPVDGPRRNRRRIAILSAIAVVLVAAVVAIVVGTRDDDSTPQVQASSPSPVVTASPAVKKKHKPAVAKRKTATTSKPATQVTTAPVVVDPETPVSSPAIAATVPPATMPAQPQASPISVLQWTVPQSVSVKSGSSTSVAVSAYNPSTGVVTLPLPLSCAPRLQHDEVCPEMAQLINPGETANATYAIDATGVKPGTYTLKAAGTAPFTVTVTA